MRYKAFLSIVLLLGITIIVIAQFSIPNIFGADGYLHIRMAQFIRTYGFKYDFHWARYSVFARNFADKDFIYHLCLIPFTFSANIFHSAKIAACIFTIFLFLVFFLMLRRYSLKALTPFFLLVFFCSAPFLQAISRPRPMVFIIAITLLYIHFLVRKNHWGLFIIAFIYALTNVSSPLLVIFVLLAETTRFLSEKEFCWKSLAATFLGLAVGFLIHPNFPHNFLIFYLNGILVPMYALKWGLELGAEFFPIDTRDFVLQYPFILTAVIFLIAAGMSSLKKIGIATRIWSAVAGLFFVFSFFSRRYIIHSYPVILVAWASYIRDWWLSRERAISTGQKVQIKTLCVGICALLFIGLIGQSSYKNFSGLIVGEKAYNSHYELMGDWMRRNIPKGEVIFHANWSDSQYFIGLNPQNDYFVTLDPIYMYYWNPEKYNLYRQIAFGRAADPYTLLKKEFGVRYGYAGKNYFYGLVLQVKQDARFEVLAEDNLGVIFRLKS